MRLTLVLALVAAAGFVPAHSETVRWTSTASRACSSIEAERGHGRPADRARACFVVGAEQRWERLGVRDGLVLMRRTPPAPGEPPMFFHPSDIAPVAIAASHPATGAADRIGPALRRVALASFAVAVCWLLLGAARVLRRRHLVRRRFRQAMRLALHEIGSRRRKLSVRRLQLATPDHYGTVDRDKWEREKAYFARTRIVPRLRAGGIEDQWRLIATAVDRELERISADPAPSVTTGFHSGMSPLDYEHHCGKLLRAAGWDAAVTGASGDQGCDVIATRGAKVLVLQCKLYSQPVGNRAVQEVAAARRHQRADHAAVVTNARFTASARQLAHTNGVHLLHHDELARFEPSARPGVGRRLDRTCQPPGKCAS